MEIKQIKIDKIKRYEKNQKKHPKSQIKKIAESIKAFGLNQPIVVDKSNTIIVGHGRYEAAHLLGMTEVPVLTVDLSEEQAKAYRLADNKLNESDWDMELVIEELKGLSTEMLALTGFEADLTLEPENKDDSVPEVKTGKPNTKLGDMWQLGDHIIVCGDSTNEETITKLLAGQKADMTFCDPPYNIGYTGGAGKRRKKIENDKMSHEAFSDFLDNAMRPIVNNTKGGIYVCMSPKEIGTLKDSFERVGGHWSSTIIWAKNNFTLSGNDYQNTYEPILYGWAEGKKPYFIDRRDLSNVWEDIATVKTEYDGQYTVITFQGFKVKIQGQVLKGSVIKKKQRVDIIRIDKPIKSELHPTMKPVSLVLESITNSSKEGDIVLDTFLGSGSTLIACEKSGRICRGVELDPHYIDVIVARWEEYTGEKAKKL
jgi:DNA modification methylase